MSAEILLPAGNQRTASQVADRYKDHVKDKVFVITGAYSGIGVETCRALLAAGAGTVIVGGRNPKLQDEFVAQLKKDYPNHQIDGHLIDLGDLKSVQKFAAYVSAKYDKIDGLILNAGVMNTPAGLTVNGLEQQVGVNCVGHFLLAQLLVHQTVRQIWLTSGAHARNGSPRIDIDYLQSFSVENTKDYDGWSAYQQSKLGDILLAKEFGKRYPPIETCSVHPGIIGTNLWRTTGGNVTMNKTIEQGAATTVHCAALPSHEFRQGAYYADCEVATESASAQNQEDAAAFFDYCNAVTKDFQ